MSICNLLCQYERENHLVPCEAPVFSWNYGENTAAPVAVRVTLFCAGQPVWTGHAPDGTAKQLTYDGPALQPETRYTVQVTAETADGQEQRGMAQFDTRPASLEDGRWLWLDNAYVRPYPVNEHYTGYSSPHFRRHFAVEGTLRRAMLYVSALGVYELRLNGRRLGEDFFSPGWTDYRTRIPYQAYDITDSLTAGDNRLDALLGDGWYRGFIIFHDRNYGDVPLKLFCRLCLEYTDGRRQVITGDDGWRAGTGTVMYSDFQMGEKYVPSLQEDEDAFFSCPVCVQEEAELTARLVPQLGPPIRKVAEFTPRLLHWKDGKAVLDVGQNLSGFVRLQLTGIPAGREIALCYGEMLTLDGDIYTANLRVAVQEDFYTALGVDGEEYRPHFTSHGFQYVSVSGISPAEWEGVTVVAEALSADCRPTGQFRCGDALVNRLYQNILWGQRSNFSSIPTDCPQRNERLGWTGDAQIFCATGCFNMDCHTYYQKYFQDMVDGQMENGAVPDVIPLLYSPEGELFFGQGNAAWADAGIIIPWRLYTFYRDRAHLEQSYPSMKRYAEYLRTHWEDGIYARAAYGDWLNIQEDTPPDLLATAYAAYDMHLMALAAEVLELSEDAALYRQQFAFVRDAFCRHFVAEDGRLTGNTQTGYILALRFGLVRDRAEQQRFAAHLAARIAECGGHLSSGFVGISYLMPVLCENGYTELAYDLLLNRTYPSWLYSVVNGATTIWERWNSYTRETGFGDVSMNSFNHYSLGSVGEWFYSHCAGIRYAQGQLTLCPYPDRRLGFCEVVYDSADGPIRSSWRYENGGITLRFFVPAGMEATLLLPATQRNGCMVYSRTERLAQVLTAGEHTLFLPV